MASRAPDLRPCGAVAGVGSLPFDDPARALVFVRRWTPHLPNWPQLPRRGPAHTMTTEFLPTEMFVDKDRRRIFADKLHGLSFNPEKCPFHDGFAAFLASDFDGVAALRGQLVGAATLAAWLLDEGGAKLDARAAECLGRWVAALAGYQAAKLRAMGRQAIITIDGPLAPGSNASAVPALAAIRSAGALAGVHTCAPTDWGTLLGLRPDVLSFDAAQYLDGFLGTPTINAALADGMIVAWGIVPTDFDGDEAVLAGDFVDRLHARFGAGLRAVAERSIITPACGLGLRDPATAERVMSACHRASAALRSAAGL